MHKIFENDIFRISFTLVWCVIVVTFVSRLPYELGPTGGVSTLTYLQTPFVVVAYGCSLALYFSNVFAGSYTVPILTTAGALLSTAMAVSFYEIWYGFDEKYHPFSFPFLHVTIHILEQIGIYLYGTGVAALDGEVLQKTHEVSWLGYIPYVERKAKREKRA